jgi:hypothetical protein
MKNEKGFATVFSLFMSLLLFSFCSTFVIVASVLSVKHKANYAAEEAALTAASTFDCAKAQELAESNMSYLSVCNIGTNSVYIETFINFESSQMNLFSNLGINVEGVIGNARAK